MIKTTIQFAVASMIIVGSVFSGCQSSSEPEHPEQGKVLVAPPDKNIAQNDAGGINQEKYINKEWAAFRKESEIKIRSNEMRIAELTVQLNKPGTTLDSLYVKKIGTLEHQNQDLEIRLESYEKSPGDWEKFKQDFNHDMNELIISLKKLTIAY